MNKHVEGYYWKVVYEDARKSEVRVDTMYWGLLVEWAVIGQVEKVAKSVKSVKSAKSAHLVDYFDLSTGDFVDYTGRTEYIAEGKSVAAENE